MYIGHSSWLQLHLETITLCKLHHTIGLPVSALLLPPIQLRLKEHREAQRSKLDQKHRYVLSVVAVHLQLQQAAVEDFLLDGDQVDQLSAFFEADGPKAVMFFYQEAEPPVPSSLGGGAGGSSTEYSSSYLYTLCVNYTLNVYFVHMCYSTVHRLLYISVSAFAW